MLPYEKTAAREVLSGDSSLTIFARGLDLEALVSVVAANKLLQSEGRPILSLNFPKTVFQRLCQKLASHPARFPLHLLPRHIHSGLSAAERNEVYSCGGIVSATPRTFAVDLLNVLSQSEEANRGDFKPVNLLGVLVYNAHEISEHRGEAFVVRLFHECVITHGWQKTFIFAFSDSAQTLSRGFHSAEKLMNLLGIERLLLFPRFHVDVIASLDRQENSAERCELLQDLSEKPQRNIIELLEVHQPMTILMKSIQDEVVALLQTCLLELKKSVPGIDLEDTGPLRGPHNTNIFHTAQRLSQSRLHSSSRSRQLLIDIQCLCGILTNLLNHDCVTFLSYLESVRDIHGSQSFWMVMERAQNMYIMAKERVFHGIEMTAEHVREAQRCQSRDRLASRLDERLERLKTSGLAPEPNSKWLLLRDILDETMHAIGHAEQMKDGAYPPALRILILGRDPGSVSFLADFLNGEHGVRDALLRKLVWYLESRLVTREGPGPSESEKQEPFSMSGIERGRSSRLSSSSDAEDALGKAEYSQREDTSTQAEQVDAAKGISRGSKGSEGLGMDSNASKDRESRPWPIQHAQKTDATSKLKFEILIKAYGRGNISTSAGDLIGSATVLPFLMETQPCAIILTDPILRHIREIEVFQAAYSRFSNIRVYALFYEDSFEYDQFVRTITEEKQAFRTLIRHKASMAVRLDQNILSSRVADGSERVAWPLRSESRLDPELLPNQSKRSRILVDIREFRSSIPGCLYQNGFDLRPFTLKVGDYVLSPDICVERKTISDLLSSLASGRLYMQCEAMCRMYRFPMLMLEFSEDDNMGSVTTMYRPNLHFSGKADQGSAPFNNTNGIGKLCLLTIHFPRLRLLWCRGPQAAAEAFATLKYGEPEPETEALIDPATDSEESMTNTAGAGHRNMMNARDHFALRPFDMLRCLPAVENVNVFALMRHFRNLSEFANADMDEIVRAVGPTLGKQISTFVSQKFSPLSVDLGVDFSTVDDSNRG
jgi:DNA excision repair protein ERCC-4